MSVTISTDKYEFAVGGRQSSRGEFSFEYGGDLYLVASHLALDGSGNIHVLKSTDSGATWAELDSANAPDSNPGVQIGFGDAWSSVVDGDSLVIVGAKYGGFGNHSKPYSVTFNLATGTWGSVTEHLTPTIYNLTSSHTQFQLIRRGTGDYLLFYSTSLNKAGYATFNGSEFGTPVDVPGQAAGTWPVSGVVDSDGTTHLLMWAGTGRKALHISLLSDNTFGTLQTILSTSNTYAVNYGQSILSDPKILTVDAVETLAFATCGELQSDTTTVPMVFCSAAIATDPTWTVALVENGAPDALLPDKGDNWPVWNPVTVAQSAGTIYVIWTHTTEDAGVFTGAFWESHSTDGVTWTPHTSLFDTSDVTNTNGWVAEQAYAASTSAGVAFYGVSGDAVGDGEGGPYLLTQYSLIGEAPTPPEYVEVECSITITALLETSVSIQNVWESGYIRLPNESPKLARLGNADLWIRGDGPLVHTWKGLDAIESVTPQLKVGSVAVTDMSATPGVVYEAKSDLKSENFTLRFETDAVDAYFELSSFTAFWRPDKYVR